MTIRALFTFACLLSTAPLAAQQSGKENSAEAITDQVERLVARPQKIALSPAQRHTVDSLKVTYLKAARAIEGSAQPGNQMQSVSKMLSLQLEYREYVQKLMKPDQIDDFLKNVQSASTRTPPPAEQATHGR